MFAVEVRDRIMIAHSLPDPFFGPAQNMHGATFVVDVAFMREELTAQNVVVTDTLPLPPEKTWDRLTVLPIAPLLARAIHEVFEDGSVTSMFDGAA